MRSVEIDSLRGVAVLLVLWTHTTANQIHIGVYTIGGYHGVLLFFVVSGFLITDILLSARSAAKVAGGTRFMVLRAFYIRRFLRIFPVYYAVLLISWLAAVPDVRRSLAWHMAYLSNWYFAWQGEFGPATAHLWSLSVEEQFYLVWPWCAIFAPTGVVRWVIGAMIVIGPVSRLLLETGGANAIATWVTTPTVLDAVGLGCLLAYAGWQANWRRRLASWSLVAGLLAGALSVLLAMWSIPRFTLDPLAWSLISVWMVHHAACGTSGAAGRLLRARPLVYVGTISYGVYLFHLFIIMGTAVAARRLGIPPDMSTGVSLFAIVTVASVGAAAISWRFFEEPIHALKNRFPYVAAGRVAARTSTVL